MGDGWFDLLWKLCEDIQSILDRPGNEKIKKDFTVVQVKEKFAGLRFYTRRSTPEIETLTNQAETDSLKICEICGKPGTVDRKRGWILTLCKSCKKKEKE